MSRLTGEQLYAILGNLPDDLVTEALPLSLLGGAAAVTAATHPLYSLSAAGNGTAAKAGFGAWVAKGGWIALAAGVLVAAGVAVGAFLMGHGEQTPPAESGTTAEQTAEGMSPEFESELEKETETAAETHPCDNGHTLDTWHTNREPACYREGESEAYCTVCGERVANPIDRTPHDFAEGYCSVCGLAEGADERFVYEFDTDKDGTRYGILAARDGAEGERIILPNVVYDPESDGMVKVGKIGHDLFREDTTLREVVIPDTVTVIGDGAFWNCSSLMGVDFPAGVQDIGFWAFLGCTSITDVTIPNTVIWVRRGAFQDCTSLETITLARLNNDIKFKEIFNYEKQHGIQLPESLKTVVLTEPDSIPGGAFSECIYVTEFVLPDTMTEIGDAAFSGCDALETMRLPASLTKISTRMFEDCRALKEITLPEGITSIGNYAFRYCESLAALYVPDSVTSIGTEALDECKSLKWISLPNSDRVNLASQFIHGGRCYLKTVIFRGGTTLREASLSQMIYLRELYLPATFNLIQKDAFKQNALKDIYFAGTAEEWEAVQVEEGNELRLSNITVHYECLPEPPLNNSNPYDGADSGS